MTAHDPDRDRQAALPAADSGKPDIARVYGYRLGGKGHYAALAREAKPGSPAPTASPGT